MAAKKREYYERLKELENGLIAGEKKPQTKKKPAWNSALKPKQGNWAENIAGRCVTEWE